MVIVAVLDFCVFENNILTVRNTWCGPFSIHARQLCCGLLLACGKLRPNISEIQRMFVWHDSYDFASIAQRACNLNVQYVRLMLRFTTLGCLWLNWQEDRHYGHSELMWLAWIPHIHAPTHGHKLFWVYSIIQCDAAYDIIDLHRYLRLRKHYTV